MITAQSEVSTNNPYLRKAMYSVYDGKCFYTGRTIPFDDIHIDHIIPKARGGKDCVENYVLCCGYINCKKNDKSDSLFVERISLINKLLFVEKVVSEYNNLCLNGAIEASMVNINDFLRNYKLHNHPKRTTFVQGAKRNLPYIEYRPMASPQNGKKGLSTKKRFYFDKDSLQQYFNKFKSPEEWRSTTLEYAEQPSLEGALKRKKRLSSVI